MPKPVRYNAQTIRDLLLKQRIATMEQLKQVLGTDVDLTVFRKLNELAYYASYSHRGRYYTLKEIPRFDEFGIWSFDSVWFSKHGTLINTIEILVEASTKGYFSRELECIVNTSVKDALRKLYQQERLYREEVGQRWLYCSIDPQLRQKQLQTRQVNQGNPGEPGEQEVFPDELKAAVILFYSLLDEKQRRLYAGLESLKWGHGGDRRVAKLLGIDEKTVARGRRELLTQEIEYSQTRRPGGGRKPLKKGLQK